MRYDTNLQAALAANSAATHRHIGTIELSREEIQQAKKWAAASSSIHGLAPEEWLLLHKLNDFIREHKE